MAMKSIKALKGINAKPIKVPKLNTQKLSGFKSVAPKSKPKSVKKF